MLCGGPFPFGSVNAVAGLSSMHSLVNASSFNQNSRTFGLIFLLAILLLEFTHAQKPCLK
jgi:hypothetical protein